MVGGVINSGPKASQALREFVDLTGFPITSTLQGLGAYPGDDPQFLGMLGMHGTYEANNAMHDCDLMINIGARFDDRITGKVDEFSPKSKKIHVDIDPSSIGKNIKVDLAVVSDVSELLKGLIKRFKENNKNFWFISKNKEEPRLADRFEEHGSELEQPLAIARDIKKLYDKLLVSKNSLTIAEFLTSNSELRHVVRRAFM